MFVWVVKCNTIFNVVAIELRKLQSFLFHFMPIELCECDSLALEIIPFVVESFSSRWLSRRVSEKSNKVSHLDSRKTSCRIPISTQHPKSSVDVARRAVSLRSNQTSNQRANPLEPSRFSPCDSGGPEELGSRVFFCLDKISSRLLIPEETWLETQTFPRFLPWAWSRIRLCR